MKNIKKVLSGALCALIAMLAPGIGAYQAAAQETNVRAESGLNISLAPASLQLQMQDIGNNSAENFLGASFSNGDDAERMPLVNPVERLDPGFRRGDERGRQNDERRRPSEGAVQAKTLNLKAALKKHAAKIVNATQKISQEVKDRLADKIANWSNNLFDGSKLAPAYAKKRVSSFNFAARKKFVLKNYLSQSPDSPATSAQDPATPPTPSSNNNGAALEAAIQSALNEAQTVSFMIKKMGVYQSAQDVVRDLKTDPSGVDSEALGNLLMTAGSIAGEAKNKLIPSVENIVSVKKSLAGKTVSIDADRWTQLKQAGQAAAQDLKDMSVVSAQIADGLLNNKASSDDIAAWKTLSAAFADSSTALSASLQKVSSSDAPSMQKAVLANAQESSVGKIVFAISFIALMITASHLAPLAVVGVIFGAGIGAAMTPKGQDSSVNMMVGMFIGLGIGLMIAPAAAHAAIL